MTRTIEELARSAARVKMRQQHYDELAMPDDHAIRANDDRIYAERMELLKDALKTEEMPVPMDKLIEAALLVESESLTENEAMTALTAAVLLEAMEGA